MILKFISCQWPFKYTCVKKSWDPDVSAVIYDRRNVTVVNVDYTWILPLNFR